MKHRFVHLPLAIAGIAFSVSATTALEPVTRTYTDIAHAAYEDSLISARALRETIRAFLDTADSGAMAYDQMTRRGTPSFRRLSMRSRPRPGSWSGRRWRWASRAWRSRAPKPGRPGRGLQVASYV